MTALNPSLLGQEVRALHSPWDCHVLSVPSPSSNTPGPGCAPQPTERPDRSVTGVTTR